MLYVYFLNPFDDLLICSFIFLAFDLLITKLAIMLAIEANVLLIQYSENLKITLDLCILFFLLEVMWTI